MERTHLTDGQLLAAFRASADEAAFCELVRRHAPMVFRTCRRVTGNTPDAEDAAQQVFAIVVAQGEKLTSNRSLAGWLYETAWHVSLRARRARGLRRRYEPRAARPGPTELNGHPDPEVLNELYRAIEMLPPVYREAVVLHHLSGLTVEQVSELMTCSAGTTAARLSRARAMMRERLSWRDIALPSIVLNALLSQELADDEAAAAIQGWNAMTPAQWSAVAAGGAGGNAAVLTAVAIRSTSCSTATGTASTAASSAPLGFFKWTLAACLAGAVTVAPVVAAVSYLGGPRSFHTSGSGSASHEVRSAGYQESYSSGSGRSSNSSGGSSSAVPEPGGLSILAAGAALALRRRSRSQR